MQGWALFQETMVLENHKVAQKYCKMTKSFSKSWRLQLQLKVYLQANSCWQQYKLICKQRYIQMDKVKVNIKVLEILVPVNIQLSPKPHAVTCQVHCRCVSAHAFDTRPNIWPLLTCAQINVVFLCFAVRSLWKSKQLQSSTRKLNKKAKIINLAK